MDHGLHRDEDSPPAASLSTDGTRLLVDGESREWSSETGEIKRVALYDITTGVDELWSTTAGIQSRFTMSPDGAKVAWAEESIVGDDARQGAVLRDVASGSETRITVREGWEFAGDFLRLGFVAFSGDGEGLFITDLEYLHRYDVAEGSLELVADATAASAPVRPRTPTRRESSSSRPTNTARGASMPMAGEDTPPTYWASPDSPPEGEGDASLRPAARGTTARTAPPTPPTLPR